MQREYKIGKFTTQRYEISDIVKKITTVASVDENINDIIIIIEVALGYLQFEGFIKCVSDINDDGIINIQDVIMLVFSILGDLNEN